MSIAEDVAAPAALAKKQQPILVRLWPIYLILAVLGFAISQGWHKQISDIQALRANILAVDAIIAQNIWIVLAAFVGLYIVCTVFIVPGGLLTIAGGALFGLTFGLPLLSTAATVFGATIGASILFLIAKTSLGSALRELAGPFVGKMEAEFNAQPNMYLLVLRLVPAVPFAVANIAPALLGARLPSYIVTTFFGILPGTIAYSWIGASAAAVLRDPSVSVSDTEAVLSSLASNVTPALIALFIVALIPILYKRFVQKRLSKSKAA